LASRPEPHEGAEAELMGVSSPSLLTGFRVLDISNAMGAFFGLMVKG